jgi:hypothetical protein
VSLGREDSEREGEDYRLADTAAGANNFLARDMMASDKAKEQIKVCSASGTYFCKGEMNAR